MAVALVEVEGPRDLESVSLILRREASFEEVNRGAYRELRRCANLELIYNFLGVPRRRKAKLLRRDGGLILLFEGGGKRNALKLLADVVKELRIQRRSFTSLKRASLIVDANAEKVDAIALMLINMLKSRARVNVSRPLRVNEYSTIEVEDLLSIDLVVVQPSLEAVLRAVSAPKDIDALITWLSEDEHYEAFKGELLRRSSLKRLLASFTRF